MLEIRESGGAFNSVKGFFFPLLSILQGGKLLISDKFVLKSKIQLSKFKDQIGFIH